jgi:hypothetical protein
MIWLFCIWRLAWARASYQAIGGWRRLFWRLWWRLPLAPLPPAPAEQPPALSPIPKPPKILHLLLLPEDVPLCGASIREPWTAEPDYATCPQCREVAQRLTLQWRMSTR